MDRRALVVAASLSALAACAGPGPLGSTYAGSARERGEDRPEAPETAESRAQTVLSSLEEGCASPDACPTEISEVPFYFPEAQVTEAERRSIESQDQEVRSLGIIARWEPGRSVEIERGNTPTYRGDLQSDP